MGLPISRLEVKDIIPAVCSKGVNEHGAAEQELHLALGHAGSDSLHVLLFQRIPLLNINLIHPELVYRAGTHRKACKRDKRNEKLLHYGSVQYWAAYDTQRRL